MITLDTLMRHIEGIATRVAGKPGLRWAVVASVAPLTIKFYADEVPLLGTPSTLVAGLAVGDRVMVAIQDNRVTIIGRDGG